MNSERRVEKNKTMSRQKEDVYINGVAFWYPRLSGRLCGDKTNTIVTVFFCRTMYNYNERPLKLLH